MNHLTDNLLKIHPARLVIVAYAAKDNFEDVYLESHAVDEAVGILEGKPLKQETIQGIVDVFFDERQNSSSVTGLIPENLLAFSKLPGGHYNMVWYRPAEKRHLYFSAELNIKSGQAWVPPMVYEVNRNDLAVYALKGDGRPKEGAKLLRAPFHNVNINGDVCLGSAKVKPPAQKTYVNLMEYWETLFWRSEFTHLNGGDSPVKGNLNLLWPKLIKDKSLTWASLDELLPIKGLTVKSLL